MELQTHEKMMTSQEAALLTSAERELVLHTFNDTATPFPEGLLIHEMFEEQAKRSPDAVAVMSSVRVLEYGDLNEKANRLSHYLRRLGVGPNQLVGICVERGPDAVVGLLGILKAGGAYVPLDPNYPPDRLRYMVEDSEPRVVLTQSSLRKLLPETNAKIIELDKQLTEVTENSSTDPSTPTLDLSAQNLVYVIYTSGSTGRPKGIAMHHQAMVNLIEWHRRNFSEAPQLRVLQFAPLSFDVAFQEIFSTLCTGGTLVMVDEWIRRDARALLEQLISQSIQRLFIPPVILQRLGESFKAVGKAPMTLKDVIVAGEQLRISPAVLAFFSHLGACRLHNHYGPTETHVVTAWTLPDVSAGWPLLPPIGRPLSNIKIYVLDEEQQPVRPGATGEIYVGGAGVARGYLGRPDLTSQRFVSNPFSQDPQSRMYKTGDLGRWRSDGVLEYLGRNDFQVKIRGFRVEPGEVEALIESYPGVIRAVVVAREDESSEKRLVGYIVVDAVERKTPDSPPDDDETAALHAMAAALRESLIEKLPQFMVPSVIVVLKEIPLSPNGKVDRSRLPAPTMDRQIDRAYVDPSTPLEESLRAIWADVLKLKNIGIDDNFFEVGGDSLVALELIENVAHDLNIEELSIIALFEAPTIREMAHFIETLSADREADAGL